MLLYYKYLSPKHDENGRICLDFSKDQWNPVITVSEGFYFIQSLYNFFSALYTLLLNDPKFVNPLVNEIVSPFFSLSAGRGSYTSRTYKSRLSVSDPNSYAVIGLYRVCIYRK